MGGTSELPVVVVADDEPAVLELFTVVLARAPVRVVTARNGEAAWKAIRTHQPEVALLDADMPLLTGLEVARLVQADPRLAGTRVLLITGHAATAAVADASGVVACLPKPIRPSELRRAVMDLVQKAA